ncbi:hypothetical protein ACQP2P_25865 [Dactylosporangium sp. CA-139114]
MSRDGRPLQVDRDLQLRECDEVRAIVGQDDTAAQRAFCGQK